jgi:hypothetical protein
MKWLRILLAILMITGMGAATAGDDKVKLKEPFDLDKAQSTGSVPFHTIDEDGRACLRDNDGRAVKHVHYEITCDLCGTTVHLLIFSAYNDQGQVGMYSAIFDDHRETSNQRSRRGIDTMISEFDLQMCLRGCSRFGSLDYDVQQ